ncbi:MAG: hypothetical protein M3441_01090 [Chloroflexota bacterium]|nr:hypothetical protein [Chloroflexota bacterium]
MGRELRQIRAGWQHPRDSKGNYIPLHDRSYDEAMADYLCAERLWAEGRHPSQQEWPDKTQGLTYREWASGAPDPDHYRAESWNEDEAVMWVVYENVSEGTPVSPPFATLPDLLDWMLRHGFNADEVKEIQHVGRLPTIRAYKQGDANA